VRGPDPAPAIPAPGLARSFRNRSFRLYLDLRAQTGHEEKGVQVSFRVRKERGFAGERDVTKIWKKLQNPFVLAGQGFLAGGLLIWTTQADAAAILSALF
jgi:hypothetical protein